SRRSIFQAKEGDDATIAAVEKTEEQAANETSESNEGPRTDERGRVKTQGVVETYFASSTNPFARDYAGVNFAVALPASERIDLIFAGQSGGGEAPQRFETTARVRLDDRHRLRLSAGAAQFFAARDRKSNAKHALGQMSIRAVDEWIVRDGVVVVLGLD